MRWTTGFLSQRASNAENVSMPWRLMRNVDYRLHPNFDEKIVASWWRHQMEKFPRYWPFVRGIHRSPVNSPHKGQWRGALIFSLICAWINAWVNNREAGDLRRHRVHYDVIVMMLSQRMLHWRRVRVFIIYKLCPKYVWRYDSFCLENV